MRRFASTALLVARLCGPAPVWADDSAGETGVPVVEAGSAAPAVADLYWRGPGGELTAGLWLSEERAIAEAAQQVALRGQLSAAYERIEDCEVEAARSQVPWWLVGGIGIALGVAGGVYAARALK